MANSRDFTGKNRKFTGTKGITVSKGTTGQRVGSESGELRFNTTTELMEYYDGNNWKPIDAPPSISSISTSDSQGTNNILNADGSTLHTITITGGNFGVGVTVKFIGNTGTQYTPGNITRVSNSTITCKTTASMGTTDDPYDIEVTNASGLSAALEDAFSFNAPPVFTNASGELGQVWNGRVVSGTTLNAGATDAEGNTITFSIISGSLPGSGLTISSSTGAITGTLASSPSLGNYPFVVRAATTEGTVERQFSLQVIADPFITATGGTIVTSGDFKIHTFTSPGTFTVTNAGGPLGSNSVNYLVVAGGGGGGGNLSGGGGGGGYRHNFPSPGTGGLPVSAQGYPITVGGGGSGASGNTGSPGVQGTPSVFSTITSTGGGGGGTGPSGPGRDGSPGGSGGGGRGYGPFPSPGGTGNSPPTSPSQGNNGGSAGGCGPNYSGGGGGGAGAEGTTIGPAAAAGGVGGAGAQNNIDGNNYYYSGGGGGGGYDGGAGAGNGGIGGGGGGAADSGPDGSGGGSALNTGGNGSGVTGGNGGANTGGGGGGAGHTGGNAPGGTAGSGIVIIRYKFQ